MGSSIGPISIFQENDLNFSFDSPRRRLTHVNRDASIGEYESAGGSIHLKNPNECPSIDYIAEREHANPLEDSLFESSIAGDHSKMNLMSSIAESKKMLKTAQHKRRKRNGPRRGTNKDSSHNDAVQIYHGERNLLDTNNNSM